MPIQLQGPDGHIYEAPDEQSARDLISKYNGQAANPQREFMKSRGYNIDSESPQDYVVSKGGDRYRIDKSAWGDATNWAQRNRFPKLAQAASIMSALPGVMGRALQPLLPGNPGSTANNFNKELTTMIPGQGGQLASSAINLPNTLSFAASQPGQAASDIASQGLQNVTAPYKSENYDFQKSPLSSTLLALQAIAPALELGAEGTKVLSERRIPQRIYAQATGMGDVLNNNPEAVQGNIDEGVWGKRSTLKKVSEEQTKQVYGPQLNTLLEGKQGNFQDVQNSLTPVSDVAKAGERKGVLAARSRVGNELLNDTFTNGSAPLSDLNYEKSGLANRGSKLYANPELKGSALGQAQKDYADALRRVVEKESGNPELLRQLSQKYYQYKSLGAGIQDLEDTANKEGFKFNPLDPKSHIVDLVTGGTATKTGAAVALDRVIKAGNIVNGYNTTALRWLMGLNASGKNETNR